MNRSSKALQVFILSMAVFIWMKYLNKLPGKYLAIKIIRMDDLLSEEFSHITI